MAQKAPSPLGPLKISTPTQAMPVPSVSGIRAEGMHSPREMPVWGRPSQPSIGPMFPPNLPGPPPSSGRLEPSLSDIQIPRKRRIFLKLIPLVVVLAGVGGFLGYRRHLAKKPLEWSGTVEVREIKAGSHDGGRVEEVLVREGEYVKAKQPLIRLEKGDLDAQRLVAQAALDNANATLQKALSGSRKTEITAAYARSNGASVTLAKTQLDVVRARRLFATGSISKTELDDAESAYRAAQAGASAAYADAHLVAEGTRREDIDAARAAVDSARGKLDEILVAIDELTITSPRDARVEALDLRPGDIIAPNATAVKLVEDSELYIRIYIPETQLARAKVGMEVPLYIDSYPDRSFRGVIETINTVGEYNPRNLQSADERANQVFGSRVRILDGAAALHAGMAAFIRLPR